MRILLIQLKRIGDFVLTAPAVAALRKACPGAEIVAVVPAAVAGLARCIPGLDRVLAYGGGINLSAWAALLLGEWDLCLDFTGTDRSALMAWISRAERSLGYAKWGSEGWRARAYTELCDASVRDLHTVDFHLALARQATVHEGAEQPPGEPGPSMRISDAQGLLPSLTFTHPLAVVHIGTAREEKFWPAERWAEVIRYLSPSHQVVLTGTNEGLERPHLDRLRALLRDPVTDLTGRLSLVELAALIARCDLALGVDSMAMHLAAMFQRPQVVLFGPTNPFHWRPQQRRAVVLAAGHDGPVTTFFPKAKGAEMNLISTAQMISAIPLALSFS
ncbi:MAG: rfaQ [Verrucomicrobiaceae bacterium]|nr:rfaQ [Verrucomicrobiaceae bacterium]